jgi:pimeloyl-ACP methyl ester carboxylesterase
MATAVIDGITTRYEVVGSGPPIQMYAPGGFDATLEKWSSQGVYAKIKLMEHLPKKYSCIIFDRRECGQSGGRVERMTWDHYVAQGKGLLDHLGIARAHILGGCMGCCPVAAFGVAHPEMVRSMILYWPVGGAKYRISSHQRFAEHLAFVQQNVGEGAVVPDHRGPGSAAGIAAERLAVLANKRDDGGEAAKQNVDQYKLIVAGMARSLFDRDTAPGAEPEDLLRLDIPTLVIPGRDAAHATSAARYLEECLPRSEYWDVSVADQTEETAPTRIMEFLEKSPVPPAPPAR